MTDLRIFRGDDLDLVVGPVLKGDGSVQNITGYSVKFTAKDRITDADGSAVISTNGTVTNGPAGLGAVSIPGIATDGFTADRVLLWDVQITDPGGKKKTVDSGKLYVVRDVTRA